MSESEMEVRMLNQAIAIAKQRLDLLEKDKRNQLSDLDSRRNLYAELKKSEVFWRGECESEERKTSTALTCMFFVCVLAAAAIAKAILVCQ